MPSHINPSVYNETKRAIKKPEIILSVYIPVQTVKFLFDSLFVGDAAPGVPSVFWGVDAPKIQKYWQAAGNPPIEVGFPDGTPGAPSPTNLFDKQKFDKMGGSSI